MADCMLDQEGASCARTHIYKKFMVPWVVRNGPNSYLNVGTYPPIYRPGRSISPAGEYGRYRRSMPIHLLRITVDRRSSIKNRDNFVVDFIDDTWQIESTTVAFPSHSEKSEGRLPVPLKIKKKPYLCAPPKKKIAGMRLWGNLNWVASCVAA